MPWNKIPPSTHGMDIDLLRAVSLVNQVIPTSTDGLVVKFEVIKEAQHISVSNGVVEFEHDGIYSIFVKMHLDVTIGFANSIETWVESSVDGVVWSPVDDTGEVKEFDAINEGTIIYKVTASITSDIKLRLKIRSTGGSPQLASPSLTNGIKVASSAISIGSL